MVTSSTASFDLYFAQSASSLFKLTTMMAAVVRESFVDGQHDMT